MTDIYAFGENWAIPAPLRTKLDTVVADWVAANPQSDPSLPGRVSTLETQTTQNAAAITTKAPTAHTHAITDVPGLRAELDSKGGTAFTPERYGAKGDGTTDDAQAIRDALAAAAGRPVVMKSGATYRVDTAIEVTGLDVNLTTDGNGRATIYHAGYSFTPLTVSGVANVKKTTLEQSTSVNVAEWKVADVTGVKPGQIMTVVSSLPWYHDPRNLAKKAELHLVDRVEGVNVYTRDPAFDTYQVPAETVEISFHDPVRVSIDNIVFKLDKPPASNSAPEKVCFIAEYAVEPQLNRAGSINGLGAGLSLRHSYRPRLVDTTSVDSCGYYTGYGVQTTGCTHARIIRPYISGSRRGVDVSGQVIPSRSTRVVDGINVGGGRDSRGAPYGYTVAGQWSGVSPHYGWGSHGPADDTVFESCRSVDMHHHYTMRGRNETILNPKIIGRSYLATIVASYGTNLTVVGAQVTNGYEGGNGQTGVNPTAVSSSDSWTPESFVLVGNTYDGVAGFIRLENNRATVRKSVLTFVDAATAPKSVTVRNNDVVFYPQSGVTPSVVACSTGTADSSGWHLSGNVQRGLDGAKTSVPLSSGVSPAISAW